MLHLILNRNAGKKPPDVEAIRALLADRGVLHVTDSIEAVDAVVETIAKDRARRVAIWGGDGTITCTTSKLLTRLGSLDDVELCFLPGGTINAVASCLGIKDPPLTALNRLLDGSGAKLERRTILRVGDRAGFLFGVGLIPNFVAMYKEAENRGTFRAVMSMVVAAGSVFKPADKDPIFKRFEARIFGDDALFAEGRFTNISAGGIHCLPLGFPAYTRATERPGAFHLIAHDLRAGGSLVELPRIKMGHGMKRCRQGVFERVVIETDGPMAYSFDGDNYEGTERLELSGNTEITAVVP